MSLKKLNEAYRSLKELETYMSLKKLNEAYMSLKTLIKA